MKEFRNRVAVVTGAASGIGRALAVRFAAEGMKVVLADVEEPALQAAAQELRDAGAAVLALRTDVSQEADVEALAVRTYEAFGGAHIVCNNAGVASRTVPSWEQTSADWQWVLSVNLWGVIHGIRAFVPRMLSSGGEGHIVNTASLAGLTSSPGLAPYNASKHAVVTISESLYFELLAVPSSMRVSVLCPGWVNTRIVDSARNRPAHLAGLSGAEGASEGIRKLVAAGLAPAEVAEKTVAAIRDERLYILTHPELNGAIQSRSEAILAGRNPQLPFQLA